MKITVNDYRVSALLSTLPKLRYDDSVKDIEVIVEYNDGYRLTHRFADPSDEKAQFVRRIEVCRACMELVKSDESIDSLRVRILYNGNEDGEWFKWPDDAKIPDDIST